jgi:Rhomboid family
MAPPLPAPAPPATAPPATAPPATAVARGPGGVRGLVGGAPLTVATLLTLAVTTTTLLGVRARGAHLLAVSASTNLDNLRSHPLDVLFVSAFWLETPWLFWPVAALVLVVLGVAERRLGSWRTLAVFVTGHVGATLVTVGGIAVGVAHGWLPSALTYAVDVGPSYGLAAVAAVLAMRTPSRRRRLAQAGVLLLALAAVAAVEQDFTDAGHLVAALLGLAVAPAVLRRGHPRAERRPGLTLRRRVPRPPRRPAGTASVPVPLARGFERHRDVRLL